MNSVGVFLEKEINGKPYHVFSVSSETDNSSSSSPSLSGEEAIDSGGGDNDLSLQTRFFCPELRYKADFISKRHMSVVDQIGPVSTSPHFNKGTVEQVVRYNYAGRSDICKHPVLPIYWCKNEKPNVVGSQFKCGACRMPEVGSGYYLCETCKKVYHKECVEAPLLIKKHPSYPSFSLQLYPSAFTFSGCLFCKTQTIGDRVYYCPTYKVEIHVLCAMKPIPIIIDHFKRHAHPLTFFPKQASLACNICGVINEYIPTYICARCIFVVHRDCIYFPYVIRICRHDHRISFTDSLPSGKLTCGVCRRKVDNSYGAYSCNNCDGYFVHSRCALRRDLWDGEELEGTPEEIEIVEDPFKTVADGIILHFSHGHHHLKLEICIDYDEDKYCQACVLPIYEGSYYSCVDDHCDFILHETCANAPRKRRHPLHAHSLTLKVVTNEYRENRGMFICNACMRNSNGFVYESTADQYFKLDVRCASISDPFKYEDHGHPLFLTLTPHEASVAACQICSIYHHKPYFNVSQGLGKLNCIECDFIICFRCATLPYKGKYKHDKHFLTFRKKLVETDQSDWCEACEKRIVHSRESGYYACNEYCCTTLHVYCLLGLEPYLKHGQTIRNTYYILRNNTMSRPFCSRSYCEQRCPQRVLFQGGHSTFCSLACLPYYPG